MRRKTRAVRRMAMGIGIFDEAALLIEPQSGGGNVVRHGIDFEKHGFPFQNSFQIYQGGPTRNSW